MASPYCDMNRKALSFCMAIALSPCICPAARQGSMLFYPTAMKTGANLLEKATWHEPPAKHAPHAVAGREKGGPLDADAPAMTLGNAHPEYAYWQALAGGVRPGRTYLMGVWAKIENAKLLFWCKGSHAESEKKFDVRVYCNSGCSPILEGYFDDDVKRRLSGDPDEWRFIARTFTVAEALALDVLNVEFGFAKAPGKATFAEPVLIDVTDQPQTLEIELRGVKPVKRLVAIRLDTRDPVWHREFDAPVTDFSETMKAASPAFHGMGADPVSGHALLVYYADRTEDRVSCPAEGLYLKR